jgi:hypothetical protein
MGPLLSIVVVSCDRYADVWPVFFAAFRRYWPDCPYSVYLTSNTRSISEDDVISICTGPDQGWSNGLKSALMRVPTPYILALQEDFLLKARVSNSEIGRCLEALVQLDGAYLRLAPIPSPSIRIPSFPMIGEIPRGAPYRASNQAAIWRREVLLSLLRPGENPWEGEIRASVRSDSVPNGFFSCWVPVLNYEGHGAIVRGRWRRDAVQWCRSELRIQPDLAARPTMSWRDEVRFWLINRLYAWGHNTPVLIRSSLTQRAQRRYGRNVTVSNGQQ